MDVLTRKIMQESFAALLSEAAKREMLSLDDPSIVCFNSQRERDTSVSDGYDGYSAHIFKLFVAICIFWQAFFAACAVWTIRYLGKNNDARSAKSRRMHLQFIWLVLLQVS